MDMKTLTFAVVVSSLALALTGCADLQNQAQGFMPGTQQQGSQVAQYEGGQQVQYIKGTGQSANTSYQANNAGSGQESSFMGDMVKSATDTLKSEASSTVRSTVRGMFSR